MPPEIPGDSDVRNAEKRKDWSIEEFLAWEEQQPDRWELIGGQPCMMAGGRIINAVIAGNIWRALDRQLRGGRCRPFSGDHVKVKTPKRVFYPDVFVRCGRTDLNASVVADPVVAVEILSPSTADVDWGEKRREYMATPSVRHYLIVSPTERLVTHWRWDDERWVEDLAEKPGDVVSLDAVGATLVVAEVFEGLEEDPDGD